MTLDDNALFSYEVLCSALRYVGHLLTSGSWQNQGWRATSHQVSKMNQVKPLMSVENTDTLPNDIAAISALTFFDRRSAEAKRTTIKQIKCNPKGRLIAIPATPSVMWAPVQASL
jgi:hypothetical protein